MSPDQHRRRLAYRVKRKVIGGVDNEPLIEREEDQARRHAERLRAIAQAARRRERTKLVQRVLAIGAAFGVLGLAIAIGAFR